MAIPLSSLLSQVAGDTYDRVEHTRKRIGNVIRETLRQETGLRLNRQDNSRADERHANVSVPISLVAGLPEPLRDFAFDDNLALVLEISPYRRDLEKAGVGLCGLEALIDKLGRHEPGQRVLKDREQAVTLTADLVKNLVDLIDREDPLKKILDVSEDILGAYIYPLPRKALFDDSTNSTEGKVELYWGVIGLVAAMAGMSVEALAAVALIHEMAHAYTHVGADIDGERWGNRAFADSDHALKEGLAQYYTDLVCRRVEHQIVDTHVTYRELLKRQPDAYRSHLPWLEQFKPEEIRLAMISVRRTGVGTTEHFEKALAEARGRLRRSNT